VFKDTGMRLPSYLKILKRATIDEIMTGFTEREQIFAV